PPAPSARGLIRDAVLSVTMSDGTNQRTIDCGMRLATMVTMANAPRVTSHPGSTPGTPTATPIRSKYPTPTPPVKAEPATSAKPPAAGAAATPRPATTPPPGATPPKPVATVKPAQQF